MKPEVSVIIPLYNKERHIGETLRSALAQDFGDFELIVVNDGSTDAGPEVVRSFSDDRIRYFETPNQGVSAARNFGISRASGKFVAFLDADDRWEPQHLTHLVALATDFPHCGLYATNYLMSYSEKETRTPFFTGLPPFPWRGVVSDFFGSSYVDRMAWTSAVMVPREVLEKVGHFREDITLGAGEDLDLWIRIGIDFLVAFDSEPSAVHNLSADNRMSLTRTRDRKFARLDGFSVSESDHLSLQKFLDLYRAEFALKMKIAKDPRAAFYLQSIKNPDNIPVKTRFLLGCPPILLRGLYRLKKLLETFGIRPSAYH